jgi:hypothetical protein
LWQGFSVPAALALAPVPENFPVDPDLSGAKEALDEHDWQDVHDELRQHERVRLACCATPEAGAWLRALPSHTLGLVLTPEEFRVALRIRLGLPVFAAARCGYCETPMDESGVHALSCMYGGYHVRRHNAVRDVFAAVAEAGALGPVVEAAGLDGGMGGVEGRRPADVLLPRFERGADVAVDFAVICPTAAYHMRAGEAHPKAALERYALHKAAEYGGLVGEQGLVYKPAVGDCFGGWSASSLQLFRKVSRRAAERSGELPGVANQYLLERVGVAVARFTARAVIGRDTAPLLEVEP